MELIGSVFLVLAVAFLVGIFISRPFLTSRPAAGKKGADQVDTNEVERLRSALLAEHERILNALQDLEFDHTLGKIPAEDYPAYRGALLAEGADTLRKLDELTPVAAPLLSAEERLEAAVAARRADARVTAARTMQPVPAAGMAPRRRVASEAGDEVEGMVAERRKVRQEKAAGFCPKCGKPVQQSDKFCSRCGAII